MTLKEAVCNKHQTQYNKNGSHKLSSIENMNFFLLETLRNMTRDLSFCENEDTE
jgi:hypothetical protein